MILALAITLIVTILLNIPIGICLGLAALVALAIFGNGIPLLLIPQRMFTGIDVSPLLAIPLFIFAGKIMEKGDISRRLINFSYATVGFLPGSLGMVTVMSCMFFAALSGSAPATVAAIGSLMLPTMIEDGYPADFSAALVAAAGMIGVIIPPSIPFVNYSIIASVSVGDMFVAGVVPGILMGATLMLYCLFISKRFKFGKVVIRFSFKNIIKSLKESIFALLMPLIILGGIYSGVFTPTEAAAVACVYGIVVGVFIYHGIELKQLPKIALEAGIVSATVMFIIATATTVSWLLTTQQVPLKVGKFICSLTADPNIRLLLINIILLINGCFMELTASLFILTPIFLPIINGMGMNLIHFGIIEVMNLTLGLITPPLGVNLFIAKGLDNRTTFNGIVKYAMPMLAILIAILLLITYVPDISLGLLKLLKG